MSILIREHFPELATWTIDQTATDLSRKALERAQAGKYSQLEVNRGMPAHLLLKYFEKKGLDWQLKDSIRSMVRYREMNLNGMWSVPGPFDLVFIRNVMIYFDVEAKKTILGKIRNLLRADGYLFLGAAETTMGLDERFTRWPAPRSGAYTLNGKA